MSTWWPSSTRTRADVAANGKPADSGRVQDAVVRLAQLIAGKADVGEFVTPTQLATAIDGLAPAGSGATGGGITVTDAGDALVLSVAPDSPFVVTDAGDHYTITIP